MTLKERGGAMTLQSVSSAPSPRVSVLVPSLKDTCNLPHILTCMHPSVHGMILVDGYPVNGTVPVARQLWLNVHIVRQMRTGKGHALAYGFALVTGENIAVIDAGGGRGAR